MFLAFNQAFDCSQDKYQEAMSDTVDDDSRREDGFVLWTPFWTQVSDSNLNPFAVRICPVCFKAVFQADQKILCTTHAQTEFYAHASCIRQGLQFTSYVPRAEKITSAKLFTQKPHEIGCKEYFLGLRFEHPLGPHSFYELKKRLYENEKSLYFDSEEQQAKQFQPNYIIISSSQFRCSLSIKPLFYGSNQISFKFEVNLTQEKKGIHQVKLVDRDWAIVLEFMVVTDMDIKEKIVNNMNFKFKRPYLHEDFIVFKKILVEMPGYCEANLNPENQTDCSKEPTSKSDSDDLEGSTGSLEIENFSQCSEEDKLEEPAQTVQDLQFINYIKTQIGSKQFQKKAPEYSSQEINQIITQVIPHLSDIVLHSYANYMFQSLLKVCSVQQRMRIITACQSMLPMLVCQQQGTFVFQQLVAQLTEVEEYTAICSAISAEFNKISLDSYGHHFLRKLFERMPKQLIKMFVPSINANLVELGTSKNGVFITQSMLKALSEIEKQSKENQYLMKKFLDNLTLHTEDLITDQFGNYLIQEAFESLPMEKLAGITEYIITFFANYSIQKFSSNVVLNCIKRWWKNDASFFCSLKSKMDNKTIREMYYNKDGNKILLEIMEMKVESSLQDKISAALRSQESSRFNNRKWVSILGKSKTGAVGTHYTNFSEAHSFTKRKHYN